MGLRVRYFADLLSASFNLLALSWDTQIRNNSQLWYPPRCDRAVFTQSYCNKPDTHRTLPSGMSTIPL